jgi:hypothetical protein
MPENEQLVRVHVNIEISAAALKAVVAHSKQKAGTDDSGHYRVDTADALAALISKFLQNKNFDQFAADIDNY